MIAFIYIPSLSLNDFLWVTFSEYSFPSAPVTLGYSLIILDSVQDDALSVVLEGSYFQCIWSGHELSLHGTCRGYLWKVKYSDMGCLEYVDS